MAHVVARFIEGWSAEDDATFFAVWEDLLHPDVRLVQPMVPPTRGFEAFRDEFTRLRALIPDLRGRVHDHASRGDTVFIELTLSGTLAGEAVSWDVVDRLTLDGEGRVVERVAYFDPTALAPVLLRHPTLWPEALRRLRAGGSS